MNTKNTNQHKAFTMVELLVVISIIGMLVFLLLPAVNAAREAARITQCKNNLKQISVAVINYEITRGYYPPGYVYVPHESGNQSGFGWASAILPFIEEKRIHKQIDFTKPVFDDVNRSAREEHLSVYLCPSDAISDTDFVEMGKDRFAMACYVGNFGPPDLDETQEKRDGIFSRNSRTKEKEIIDGHSKTFMIGERENGLFRSTGSHDNHTNYETTWIGAVRDIDDPTDDHGHMVLFQTGHTPNHTDSDDRDVSAPHSGLSQFALCDASVLAVSESVDLKAYQALSTRWGSEPN